MYWLKVKQLSRTYEEPILSTAFFSVVILFINCYSVNLATGVMNVFTTAKLIAIMIVICGGAYKLFQGKFEI